MPTLKLYYNTTNDIPAATDNVHYRSFTVDFADDRDIEEVKEPVTLLNRSVVWDRIGIRRRLKFHLRVSDVNSNIDFLTSFFNAEYNWALIPDAGYYFNIGTIASPVVVPVYTDKKGQDMSVRGMVENGIELITANVYARPAAPTLTKTTQTSTSITVAISGTSLKQRLYNSDVYNGVYTFILGDTDSSIVHTGLTPDTAYFYKASIVTIGGESELSSYAAYNTNP